MKRIFLSVLIIAVSVGIYAQDPLSSAETILIRNVTVLDQSRNKEDVIVSILIKKKNLNMVTKDEIAVTEADISFDAKGGFILGTLEIGNPANFLILDQDPRTHVDVMLDTKSFTVFALSKGEVVLNKLIRIDGEPGEHLTAWQSYAPPPVALPIYYQNKRKWNVFRTKPVTIILGGAAIMENTRWLSQDNNNDQQVGDVSEYKGGSIRGMRAGIGGTINFKKPWTYLITGGTRAFERGFEQGGKKEFASYDYKVSIPIGSATLSLGKLKENISMSRMSAMIYETAQQERASVCDALLPARNIGVVINNTILKNRMTWSAGVFNNWYENKTSFSNNPTVFVGRISGLPFISDNETQFLHLGAAGRYSNGAGGILYKTKTEIFSGPVSAETDLIDDASSTLHFGLEFAYGRGPFNLLGEYMQANVSSATFNDPSFKGYYVVASYVLSGEMRTYNKRSGLINRVNVAHSVNSGGWGALEVYCRWSSLDLSDKSIDGGEMNTLSLGVNWTPIQAIQLNVNYRSSSLDRFGVMGNNHGLVTRLAFVLE